ncbi:unnamed protein product [Cylicocyclus nassatus]|uniref:Uncharacterized protein n=1 Tax=Cylicocyclus nassatus TaxID=53992 RepID=A0AA36M6M9_CYLNA|nr:unnamed protein product [Cylicocyclus nassatus]
MSFFSTVSSYFTWKKPEPPKGADDKQKAAASDPNYQTLTGLSNDVFTKPSTPTPAAATPAAPAPAAKQDFQKPATQQKAAASDPNYQTLTGLSNDIFTKPSTPTPAAPAPAAKQDFQKPATQQKAAASDPNYQTLTGLSNDIFTTPSTPKPPAKQDFQKPATEQKVAASDPNYQTLTGLSNDIFSKPSTPTPAAAAPAAKQDFQKPATQQKAAASDPNYQTLTGLSNDIFTKPSSTPAPSATPKVEIQPAPASEDPLQLSVIKEPSLLPKAKSDDAKPKEAAAPTGAAAAENKFQTPDTKQVAAASDPNYQTLRGLSNDDVFLKKDSAPAPPKDEKKDAPAPAPAPASAPAPAPAAAPKPAAASDDNYENLNGPDDIESLKMQLPPDAPTDDNKGQQLITPNAQEADQKKAQTVNH